jgi:hypothetical protein
LCHGIFPFTIGEPGFDDIPGEGISLREVLNWANVEPFILTTKQTNRMQAVTQLVHFEHRPNFLKV